MIKSRLVHGGGVFGEEFQVREDLEPAIADAREEAEEQARIDQMPVIYGGESSDNRFGKAPGVYAPPVPRVPAGGEVNDSTQLCEGAERVAETNAGLQNFLAGEASATTRHLTQQAENAAADCD